MKMKFQTKLLALILALAMLSSFFCACKPADIPEDSTTVGSEEKTEEITEPEASFEFPENNSSFTIGNVEGLEFTYTDADKEAILAEIDTLNSMLETADPAKYDEFKELYDKTEDDFYAFADQCLICQLLYYLNQSNETYSAKYLELTEVRTDLLQKLIAMYKPIYESVYSEKFYEDWDPDEVIEAVHLAESYTEEAAALQAKSEEYEVAVDALSSAEFMTGVASIYEDFVKNRNDYAKLLDYDNYMDYAYAEVYGRDYTKEEAAEFTDLVKEYVVPVAKKLNSKIILDINNMSSAARGFLSVFLYNTYKEANCKTVLEQYAEAMGGTYAEEYQNLWENGIYFLTSSPASYDGAFTTRFYTTGKPLVYFSGDYQNALTIVHEFGHYHAFTHVGIDEEEYPMDLCETQSQGNEWLFLSTLPKYRMITSEAASMIVEYQFFNNLLTIIIASVVNDFETYVYTHPDLTKDDYDKALTEIALGYGGIDFLNSMMGITLEEYWRHVAIRSAGYYISYAISLIPSLEFFAIAKEEGFDVAKEKYFAIVEPEGELYDFIEVLEGAGLGSPFEAETFEKIMNVFGKICGLTTEEETTSSLAE